MKILPKAEEATKKKFKRSSAWRSQEFWFFWYFLRFWQGFGRKYCQNLRRYQQNQSLEVKILPKPEEVPKKKNIETAKPKTSETLFFFVFFVPPQVLARFSPPNFVFLVPPQVLATFSLKTLKNWKFFYMFEEMQLKPWKVMLVYISQLADSGCH